MKIAVFIARVLLGLLFLVFGLNGFLHFIPMPLPPGMAGQYLGILFVSHYLTVIFLVEVVGAVLLLANRFVPLALILLAPVLVNILLFHPSWHSRGSPWRWWRLPFGWSCFPGATGFCRCIRFARNGVTNPPSYPVLRQRRRNRRGTIHPESEVMGPRRFLWT